MIKRRFIMSKKIVRSRKVIINEENFDEGAYLAAFKGQRSLHAKTLFAIMLKNRGKMVDELDLLAGIDKIVQEKGEELDKKRWNKYPADQYGNEYVRWYCLGHDKLSKFFHVEQEIEEVKSARKPALTKEEEMAEATEEMEKLMDIL